MSFTQNEPQIHRFHRFTDFTASWGLLLGHMIKCVHYVQYWEHIMCESRVKFPTWLRHFRIMKRKVLLHGIESVDVWKCETNER